MTLIEIMISMSILVITFVALASAMLFAYRAGAQHKNRLFAIELANSAIEEVKGTPFFRVAENPADPLDPLNAPNYTIESDPAALDASVTFQVIRNFKGSGPVASGSGSGLVANPLAGMAPWIPNEFVGHQVMITAGTGNGQIRTITANTTNSLSVDVAWVQAPNNTSTFLIDGGKTLEVIVRWVFQGRPQEYSITSLIIQRG